MNKSTEFLRDNRHHNAYVKKDGMKVLMKIVNNVIRLAKNVILLG